MLVHVVLLAILSPNRRLARLVAFLSLGDPSRRLIVAGSILQLSKIQQTRRGGGASDGDEDLMDPSQLANDLGFPDALQVQ